MNVTLLGPQRRVAGARAVVAELDLDLVDGQPLPEHAVRWGAAS